MTPRKSEAAKLKADSLAVDVETKESLELCPDSDLPLFVGEDLGQSPVSRFSGYLVHVEFCLAHYAERPVFHKHHCKMSVQFSDDKPDALFLILNIVHLRFDKALLALSDELLKSVATIDDKYDIVAICRPFVVGWMRP